MDDLDAMYQEIILDAAKARNGEGRLERFQGESFQVNTTCGDEVNLQVELSSDGKRIERIGWTGDGCSISRASIGIMIDMLEGRSVREAADLYDVFRALMDSPRARPRRGDRRRAGGCDRVRGRRQIPHADQMRPARLDGHAGRDGQSRCRTLACGI